MLVSNCSADWTCIRKCLEIGRRESGRRRAAFPRRRWQLRTSPWKRCPPTARLPSEGSVSTETLAIAHELGVRWMATDEGVLGRSLGINFSRDGYGHLNSDLAHRL